LIVVPQPEAVIRIASSPHLDLAAPGIDIAARRCQRLLLLADMMTSAPQQPSPGASTV